MPDREVTIRISATDNFSDVTERYNRAMREAGNATDNVGQSSQRASGGIGGLGNAIGGMISAIALDQVIDFGVELYNLGNQSRIASETFTQLVGGTEAADEALAVMRERTGGVIDDITLMDGASRLLLTGLAESGDEAARFTELAVRLGGAMGMDASGAIENFNAALLNMSYQRLDTLGISAGRVRQQVAALKEEGYSTEEAFRFAVLEQGTAALERLGDAAYAGETAIGRLSTQFQNLQAQVGENVAAGVEGIVGNIQNISDHYADAREEAVLFGQTFTQTFGSGDAGYMAGLYSNMELAARDFEAANGRSIQSVDEMETALLNLVEVSYNISGFAPDAKAAMDYYLGMQYAAEQAAIVQARVDALSVDMFDAAAGAAVYAQQLADAAAAAAANAELQADAAAWEAGAEEQTAALMEEVNVKNELLAVEGDLVALTGQRRGYIGETALYTRAEADEAGRLADEYEAAVDQAEALNEHGLISDEELENIRGTAETMRDLADQAERGADALERMSLSELFGQSGGGALGELTDKLLEQGETGGMSEEQLTALEQALNMASGRETASSVEFEERVLPLLAQIASEQGAEAAATASQAFLSRMAEGRQSGMSEEQLATLFSLWSTGAGETDFGLYGSQFGMGMDEAALMSGGGMGAAGGFNAEGITTIADAMTTVGEQIAGFAELTPAVSGDFEAVQTSTEGILSNITAVADALEGVTSNVQTIRVRLTVEDLPGELAAILGGGFGAAMSSATRANGGTAPGADARASASTTSRRGGR